MSLPPPRTIDAEVMAIQSGLPASISAVKPDVGSWRGNVLLQLDPSYPLYIFVQRPVARRTVDYRLIGSAIARVRWELDLNPRWQRDPAFHVEPTVAALQEELMPPPPLANARCHEIVVRTENIPSILEQAKLNLKAIAPFAQLIP